MTTETALNELMIRSLADKFSDAANRRDGEMFASLWSPDGVWKIGPPINVEFRGRDNMAASVMQMLGLWDFFVQLTTAGVVHIEGNRAYARFYVQEVARRTEDGSGNFNLSMYEDELEKVDGRWYFTQRVYHTIYQDAPHYTGMVLPVPQIPEHVRVATLNK